MAQMNGTVLTQISLAIHGSLNVLKMAGAFIIHGGVMETKIVQMGQMNKAVHQVCIYIYFTYTHTKTIYTYQKFFFEIICCFIDENYFYSDKFRHFLME